MSSKCFTTPGALTCVACLEFGIVCTYDRPTKRRGVSARCIFTANEVAQDRVKRSGLGRAPSPHITEWARTA